MKTKPKTHPPRSRRETKARKLGAEKNKAGDWPDPTFVMHPSYRILVRRMSTILLWDQEYELTGADAPTYNDLVRYIALNIRHGSEGVTYRYSVWKSVSRFDIAILVGQIEFAETGKPSKLAETSRNRITISTSVADNLTACELGRGRELDLRTAVYLRNAEYIDTSMALTKLGAALLSQHREEKRREPHVPWPIAFGALGSILPLKDTK